jgi:hypothetical protein
VDREPPPALGHFERQLIDVLSDICATLESIGVELSDIREALEKTQQAKPGEGEA